MASFTVVPSTFALSNDVAIEAVLGDIPLLCIGILGMGAFTVFLLLRRVNLFASYLFASSLLAFAAAILDLSQILARGDVNTDKEVGLDRVSGLINAREIFLALSVGFIYILFWTLVAQCPPGESTRLLVDINGRHGARDPSHSASWRRWGFIGITLKWISLLASISIPLLQMLWRIVTSQRKYGNLYVAESTIETVVSAIFILKLLLNIYLCPLPSRWRSSGRYVTSIFSLIISAGLGVGNLIIFSFSETSLGRFLRAVEIYILILYSLVVTFSNLPARHRHCTTKDSDITKITPFGDVDYSTGLPKILDRRISGISLMGGSNSNPAKKMGWDQELGLAPRIPSIALYPAVSVDQWEAESPHSSVSKNITSSSGGNSPYERSVYGVVNIGRPLTDLSLTYYTMNLRSPEPEEMHETTINGAESPDFALQQGEREGRLDANLTLSPSRSGSSVSSFEELLRRQSELDRSIAALRLLSPRLAFSNMTPFAHQTNGSSDQIVPLPTTLSRNTLTASLITSKPESASALSDFSLSVFPDPPAPSNVPLLSSGVPGETTSPDALNGAPKDIHTGVLSAQVPIRRASSSFARGSPQVCVSAIFDSEGTQYDVTSFVGGLAGPTRGVLPESNFNDPSFLDEFDSEDETTPTITTLFSVPSRGLRPMILASTVTPRVSSNSPSEASASRAPDSNPLIGDSSVAPMPLRPFLLGTSSPLMPSSTMVPVGFRKIRAVSGRRPTISGPRPPTPDGRGDQAPGAFERPRPPPLILSGPNW